MKRHVLGGCLTAALVLLALVVGCRGGGDAADVPSDTAPVAATTEDATPTDREIVLYFPGTEDEMLHAQKRSVIPIAAPEDRAKQCLEELVHGPQPPLLAAVPDGVKVRQIYLLPDGTMFVDLSSEMLNHRGGSLGELQTVYAIVDTLTVNVPEIRHVGILVDGRSRDTLAGHIDISMPLPPDYQYIDEAVRPAAPPRTVAPPRAGATTGASAASGASGESGASAGEGDASAAEGHP